MLVSVVFPSLRCCCCEIPALTTVNVMPPMIYIRALVPYCVLHYVRLNVCCLVSKYGNAVFISPCFVCAFGGVEGTPGG